MFICTECGRIYEELRCSRESYGAVTPDECVCGGDIVEAKECEACGEYIPEDASMSVCKWCIEEEMTVATAIKMGRHGKSEVKINGFFATVLTEQDIDEILEAFVEQHFLDKSKPVREYILEDPDYLEDWIINGGADE